MLIPKQSRCPPFLACCIECTIHIVADSTILLFNLGISCKKPHHLTLFTSQFRDTFPPRIKKKIYGEFGLSTVLAPSFSGYRCFLLKVKKCRLQWYLLVLCFVFMYNCKDKEVSVDVAFACLRVPFLTTASLYVMALVKGATIGNSCCGLVDKDSR